jgi:hypothetical protein
MCHFCLRKIIITLTLTFWEADFHKIKGKKILSRSPHDFNTTNNKERLTESFSTSIELCDAYVGIYNFCF